jgi:hypothetical protein
MTTSDLTSGEIDGNIATRAISTPLFIGQWMGLAPTAHVSSMTWSAVLAVAIMFTSAMGASFRHRVNIICFCGSVKRNHKPVMCHVEPLTTNYSRAHCMELIQFRVRVRVRSFIVSGL